MRGGIVGREGKGRKEGRKERRKEGRKEGRKGRGAAAYVALPPARDAMLCDTLVLARALDGLGGGCRLGRPRPRGGGGARRVGGRVGGRVLGRSRDPRRRVT